MSTGLTDEAVFVVRWNERSFVTSFLIGLLIGNYSMATNVIPKPEVRNYLQTFKIHQKNTRFIQPRSIFEPEMSGS